MIQWLRRLITKTPPETWYIQGRVEGPEGIIYRYGTIHVAGGEDDAREATYGWLRHNLWGTEDRWPACDYARHREDLP